MNTQLLDGMVIFREVMKYGSFTKAADRTGHSTSYISKEINRLEERLGVRLLHRTTRSLSLTPEGELYYEQCRQIVQDAEELENAMLGRQVTPRGNLKISCPTSFGLTRLAPVLRGFSEAYPDISLNIELNDRKIDLVAEGFDIAIRASQALNDSSLISRKIHSSHAATIATPAYLEKHGFPTHPKDLVNHKVISYSNIPSYNTWRYKDHDGSAIDVELQSFVVSNSSQLELLLCLSGEGITRMPLFNLNGELDSGELVELFSDFPRTNIDVFIVYPSRKHMSSKVRCFIDFLIEAMEVE